MPYRRSRSQQTVTRKTSQVVRRSRSQPALQTRKINPTTPVRKPQSIPRPPKLIRKPRNVKVKKSSPITPVRRRPRPRPVRRPTTSPMRRQSITPRRPSPPTTRTVRRPPSSPIRRESTIPVIIQENRNTRSRNFRQNSDNIPVRLFVDSPDGKSRKRKSQKKRKSKKRKSVKKY